jgi:Methylamine utilisation protein MauE
MGSMAAVLGLVFLVAGLSKVVKPDRFRVTLLLSGMAAAPLVPATRIVVPVAELGVATLLISGLAHPAGSVMALALLLAFTVSVRAAVTKQPGPGAIACGCLGTAGERLDTGLVARNLLLIAYAIASLAGPSATEPFTSIPEVGGWAVGIATAGLAAAPFVLAEIVSLWQATGHIAELPGLSGDTPQGANTS